MEFRHVNAQATEIACDILAVPTFGDPARDPLFKAVDQALGGGLTEAARAESFDGKPGQVLTLWAGGRLNARRVVVLGLGAKGDVGPAVIRDMAAAAAQAGTRTSSATVAIVLPALAPARLPATVQQAVEGVLGGTYKFTRYLSSEDAKKPTPVQTVLLVSDVRPAKGGKAKVPKLPAAQARAVETAIQRGQAVGAAVARARDLVNEPAGTLTPAQLAAEAEAVAKKHKSLSITVLDAKKCEELGMGMFLAVARGSDQPPKFIHMVYKPAKKPKKRVALIGKGLTFDSGGYSLKPSNAMEDMKVDMAGAAAVIAAMDAIATIGCDAEVHAVSAICENLVSGRAFKLGDVLTSMDGTTVEINNTDAEGRLTLGDAITYVRTRVQPDEMFDFATLTGACMVALGPYTAGVMSDTDRLAAAWMAAAERSGEEMWRLPLLPRLREQLKSNVADMRNTGDRYGGAITAGLFLKTFVKDTAWVHIDLAGPASISGAGRPSQPRGGSGFGVATIVEYLTGR